MPISCLIISLDPQGENSVKLSDDLRSLGVNFDFFTAVDGRSGVPELREGEFLDQEGAVRFRGAELGGGEVGCFLSHFRLIGKLYESGCERACILEDDVALDDGFIEVLCKIDSLPIEYEFIRLMGLTNVKRKVVLDLGGGRRLVNPLRGMKGTQGYVVNRVAMQKILSYGAIIRKPIDVFYDYFWEFDLRCYGVEPHVIYEIERPSNIPKPKRNKKDGLLCDRISRRIRKFISSIRRRLYVMSRITEFLPATMPKIRPGNTVRMK
jgi:glycosyl transferase family 25